MLLFSKCMCCLVNQQERLIENFVDEEKKISFMKEVMDSFGNGKPEHKDIGMKVYLIRHGATQGNREHRYVGRTDEGILETEKERLRQKAPFFPEMDKVFVSPYLRCRQTAEIFFSAWSLDMPQDWECKAEIVGDFREMDFGEFEYKNYQELIGNEDYQRFIDSGGTVGFPGGENPEAFKYRCRRAFKRCIIEARANYWQHVGFVVHGGTIMAIMEEFSEPQKEYFEYQVGNGCGYVAYVEEAAEEKTGKKDLGLQKYQGNVKRIKLKIEEEIK